MSAHAGASALERLLAAPRVSLAHFPTPIETVAASAGPAVLVKRDDRSGWGRGGAKARKIEHLLGELKQRGRDELVTVVGNITNLAFDLLPALDANGIRGSLFVIDDPPAPPAEREAIFAGVRERVTLLGPSRAQAVRAVVGRWLAARREGGRPLWTLPGVSHPAAVIGNACGFVEMALQREREGRSLPKVVYVSAATGTTIAGFLLGEHALREAGRAPIRVVGVQVYPGRMHSSVSWLLRWTEDRLGLVSRVPRERIEIDVSELGDGFGRYPASLAERCLALENEAGLKLDPIFGGKTWAAMSSALARERARDETALYWHCGYTPEWRQLGSGAHPAVRRSR
ncbi:MAG TPA: pyridoxal-phosphate dependent enzyme [Polyangiaceae bacterium]|nr:pyridoxal-phosphate dependent enzyme [Polyangiaceae bacterium]